MDHGTLRHFRDILHRVAVGNDHKKAINACLDLVLTVLKGHLVASACEELGIEEPTHHPASEILPYSLRHSAQADKKIFIDRLGKTVLEKCSIIPSSFLGEQISDNSKDNVHNYTRVFCHYASVIMEFLDGWSEGDGERIYRLAFTGYSYVHAKFSRYSVPHPIIVSE